MARMAARMFACVLAADAGRGADTRAGRVAEKGREPGARRDHYRVGKNAWYEMFVARAPLMRHNER
jgi:hypothetical protein